MYLIENEFEGVVEIEKQGEEPLCFKAPSVEKAYEFSLGLDVVNTEFDLGLKINLHIQETNKSTNENKQGSEA